MQSVIIKSYFTDKDVEVKIGDWVGFKADVAQSGQIVEIRKNSWGEIELVLQDEDGFIGEYIGGDTTTVIKLEEAWVD